MYINKTEVYEEDTCDHILVHLSWNMKGGTLYLANSKWQGYNPRPKKMSTSQAKHPADLVVSPVHSIEATVTGKHQTFLMEALEQFLTQPPPPRPNTHITSQHHTFSLLHTICCCSCGLLSPPSISNSF